MGQYKYNQYTQMLFDIEEASQRTGKKIRVYLKDQGTKDFYGFDDFIGKPECWCYETIDDDENIDALRFVDDNGKGIAILAGQWIEKWEVVDD